jgi:hypothetical protein
VVISSGIFGGDNNIIPRDNGSETKYPEREAPVFGDGERLVGFVLSGNEYHSSGLKTCPDSVGDVLRAAIEAIMVAESRYSSLATGYSLPFPDKEMPQIFLYSITNVCTEIAMAVRVGYTDDYYTFVRMAPPAHVIDEFGRNVSSVFVIDEIEALQSDDYYKLYWNGGGEDYDSNFEAIEKLLLGVVHDGLLSYEITEGIIGGYIFSGRYSGFGNIRINLYFEETGIPFTIVLHPGYIELDVGHAPAFYLIEPESLTRFYRYLVMSGVEFAAHDENLINSIYEEIAEIIGHKKQEPGQPEPVISEQEQLIIEAAAEFLADLESFATTMKGGLKGEPIRREISDFAKAYDVTAPSNFKVTATIFSDINYNDFPFPLSRPPFEDMEAYLVTAELATVSGVDMMRRVSMTLLEFDGNYGVVAFDLDFNEDAE